MKGLPRAAPEWRDFSPDQINRMLDEEEIDTPVWDELRRLVRAYQSYTRLRARSRMLSSTKLLQRIGRRRGLAAIEVEAIRVGLREWSGADETTSNEGEVPQPD